MLQNNKTIIIKQSTHENLRSEDRIKFEASLGCDVGFPSVCCEYHWLIKNLQSRIELHGWEGTGLN